MKEETLASDLCVFLLSLVLDITRPPHMLMLLRVFVCACERDRGREQSQVNLRVDFAGFPRVQGLVVHRRYSVCWTLPRKSDYLYKQESLGKQNKTAILFAV